MSSSKTRQRVGEIVRDAATLASTHLAARDLPALPNTSPHTLRRTYISVALLANRFDVLWVMRQVGHADSHMTMDVYAQLQQRAERQHGEAFDDLVRQARERLYGTAEDADGEDEEAKDEPRLEDLVDESCGAHVVERVHRRDDAEGGLGVDDADARDDELAIGDPADRVGVRRFLSQFAGQELEVALEATTGWRFVVEELQAVGAEADLAEPAERAR